MHLLNPRQHDRRYPDAASKQLMLATIAFFEKSGPAQLRENYHTKRWYDDFLAFIKEHKVFSTLLTPKGEGPDSARWDTYRNCEFNEILGFYGLEYWYTWQVTVLGLGPLWMSENKALRARTHILLDEGGIFAFGPVGEKPTVPTSTAPTWCSPKMAKAVGAPTVASITSATATRAAIVSTFGRFEGHRRIRLLRGRKRTPSLQVHAKNNGQPILCRGVQTH